MLTKMSDRTVRKGCKVCGSTQVYWAKDDSTTQFVLVDASTYTRSVPKGCAVSDTERHTCNDNKVYDRPRALQDDATNDTTTTEDNKVSTETTTKPASDDAATKIAASDTDAATAALAALRAVLTPTVDRSDVLAIVKDEIASLVFPTRTVVVRDDVRRTIEGATHAKLADVTTDILAGEHVLMVGPAGTGKSTIAEQTAEALGLPFFAISLSPQTSSAQVIGYMQAAGQYVRTLFREAYENGGLFHFDEFDNGHPSVLALINSALANGHMAFPDGMVKRHDDFRVIASANTYGRGPDRQYVGRQALDAATLDRFSVETIDIDTALERQLCIATGIDAGKADDILKYVYKLRDNADAHKLPVVVSPRAAVGACRLIVAGRAWRDVVAARMRRGLSDADWRKLSTDVPPVTF